MRFVRFNGSGGNEIVSVAEGENPEPAAGQVLVQARFAGVNPADVLQRNGGYPVPAHAPQDIPGLEVSGTVVQVGPGVTQWQSGDRVMGIVSGGGLADHVIAEADHLWRTDDSLSELAAAALPEAVVTAFDALNRTRTQLGDVVVVRGVNGGVGFAAYQIAVALGATAIGVGRSPLALEAVTARGMTAVVDSEVEALIKPLGGASVVVELVGGSHVATDLEWIHVGGRIVVVSTAGGVKPEVPLNLLMGKRADISGTVLRGRTNGEKAVLISDLRRRLGRLLGDGALSIPVDEIFPAAKVTDAFERLGTAGKVGKVLIDFAD